MIREFAVVRTKLATEPGVTVGRMFGSQGLKVEAKVFAMEVKGRLVVKLTTARAAELCDAGLAEPFDPGHGRPMKQWAAVAPGAGVDWLRLSREALEFVGGR
jgi:TfoX/Sxy family transcriptional regulator of competence genes